ncbi:hypothetical protein [Riemerella columbipharyngis]|uniref:Head domain of trimeric autotransporter adhesin n=1 Tax=Riemerella columbipharyngis TaxID=1071918 RepID=A0A1G7G0T8_9FLAO|nr:hypothetical protein [Riemerella columbipharyngis]SDE81751.1 Head domain of trimeric autotransporter adhesin [Riemerella columbipharyngis]
MKKNLIKINLLCTLMGTMAYAQQGRVGINTDSPKATLDINAIDGENASGILIPRLNRTQFEGLIGRLGADQKSMLVYLMEDAFKSDGTPEQGTGPSAFKTGTKYLAGYYKWNGTDFQPIEGNLLSKTTTQIRTGRGNIFNNSRTRTGYILPGITGDVLYNGVNFANGASIAGVQALAIGNATKANGTNSFAGGNTTIASGENSFAIGQNQTTASGISSFAGGAYSLAAGEESFAFGVGAVAQGDKEIALGVYNTKEGDNTLSSEFRKRLLTVGNGESDSNRKDAFTILKSGKVGIGYNNFEKENNDAVLQVKGAVLSDDLKGTGDRPVYADANGVLKIGPSSAVYTAGQGMNLGGTDHDANEFWRTGLEEISGNNGNKGLAIVGRDPENYGKIGSHAVDLSYNIVASETKGATGHYSVAMGSATTASGTTSFAMGQDNIASGDSSFAMGARNTASGDSSFAIGFITTASGQDAVAMGYQTTASGNYSVAMGQETTASQGWSLATGYKTKAQGQVSIAMGNTTTASGNTAVAMGNTTTASGARSVAMGDTTTASGNTAIAMGYQTTASGTRSVAMGNQTTALGINSVAMGQETTASAGWSLATGYKTKATGDVSTAMGNTTTASGSNAVAMGYQTTASGARSVAMGYQTTASGINSVAMGNENIANGNSSVAIGNETQTDSFSELAIGTNNTRVENMVGDSGAGSQKYKSYPISNGDWEIPQLARRFVIGNGSTVSSNPYPSDAFTVLNNASVGINIDNFEKVAEKTDAKLVVNGGIKLHNGGDTKHDSTSTGGDRAPAMSIQCNQNNEGVIRYNRDNHKFEGCNGSSWVTLG